MLRQTINAERWLSQEQDRLRAEGYVSDDGELWYKPEK